MLKHIVPLIRPHVCYCETFAGGLAVLLAKERSEVEVVNDINGSLVALYRNLQFHLPAILKEFRFLFASRQNFRDFLAQPGLTEIQKAARFLLLNRTSFAGDGSSFGVVKTAGGGVALHRKGVARILVQANARLDGVVVENLPYDRCLANYDSKETFHFIDPPYLNAPTKNYAAFTEADLRLLRKRVEKLKGQWLVTLDDSRFNRELFSDCAIKELTAQNRLCNNRTHSNVRRGELIITPQ